MTAQEAVELIGMPPSAQSGEVLEWRRGGALTYDATPNGAIVIHLKDGRVVDVPEGGIFGPLARQQYIADWVARQEERDRENSERLQRDARRKAEEAARLLAEAAAEQEAAATAGVTCNVKTTCAKVFSLAQIFIATRTDQKIQVVTDSVIQTYNPTDIGKVGASIIKMPQRGDNALVSLSLMCKDEGGYATSLCHTRNTALYKEFRPFIEKQLQP